MSSTAPASPAPPDPAPEGEPQAPPPEAAAVADPSLAGLRAEIDRLDDALHDILMQRAGLVAQVAALGAQGKKIPFRPGREAEIIRRLLARHGGPLPRRVLPRLWRELFAATTAMQGHFIISVCEPDPPGGFATLAREHFGVMTPLRVHRSPAQAIAEVSSGAATAAVLPLPVEEESPRAAWWTALLHRDEPRIHVVARLPFWAPRTEGASQARAMVLAAAAPDPSSRDRSLLGFELPPEMSRARLAGALTSAGLAPASIILRRDPGGQIAHGLIDVEGYVTDDDARLASLGDAISRPVVLGAYAVPVEGEP
jgi:chorismate mutase / prephenate dehydratase